MNGTIYCINEARGMVAIETQTSDFSVFEITGSDNFEVGDKVEWPGATSLGGTQLTNRTKNQTSSVYFQNHWVPKHQLRQQLLLD